jgi:hypothetical protein
MMKKRQLSPKKLRQLLILKLVAIATCSEVISLILILQLSQNLHSAKISLSQCKTLKEEVVK